MSAFVFSDGHFSPPWVGVFSPHSRSAGNETRIESLRGVR